MHNPERTLFSDELWNQSISLEETLTTHHQWLGEYMSRPTNNSVDTRLQRDSRSVVALGSETGKSSTIDESLVEAAIKQDKNLDLVNLIDAKLRYLSTIHQLFIVCSTHRDRSRLNLLQIFIRGLLLLTNRLSIFPTQYWHLAIVLTKSFARVVNGFYPKLMNVEIKSGTGDMSAVVQKNSLRGLYNESSF